MRTINKKNTKSFTIKMWFHRIWIAFCFLCLICFSGFCIWAWKSGVIQDTSEEIIEEFHNITGNMGFRLDDIFIDGRIRTEKTEIRTALDLPVDNLMTKLNIEQMQKNLTELPWVKEASVSRQLPNILYIRLTEKKPIALWQKGKQHYPIDEDGNIIDTKCEDCINLPIIVGDKAYLYAPKLIKTLENFEILYARTVSAVLVGSRRWNLYIDDIENGIVVLLPDTDLMTSLTRLETLHNEHNILNKDLKKIDLRQSDKTIIEPNTEKSIILPDKGDDK